jgi:ABC-2 type transport system permease protein
MGAIAWLQARQIVGDVRGLLVLALFAAVPLALATTVQVSGGFGKAQDGELASGIFLFVLYPQATCLLLALLHGTSIINAEVTGKTLTYLFTRPIPRWRVVVAKYAAIAACLAVPAVASLAAAWAIVGAPGGLSLLGSLAAATAAAVCAYTAVFAALGTLFTRRPMVVGLLYGIVEFGLSFIPAIVSTTTISYFLRSIVVRLHRPDMHGMPAELRRIIGDATLPFTAAVLAGIVVAGLGVAALVTASREYAMVDQAP